MLITNGEDVRVSITITVAEGWVACVGALVVVLLLLLLECGTPSDSSLNTPQVHIPPQWSKWADE